MPTKYARQIKSARATIARKGTTCTWYKAVDDVNSDDLPEFQNRAEPVAYANTPIVFYPMSRLSLQTVLAVALTGSYTDQLYSLIPGDVPFTPTVDDAVLINGEILHVASINTTQPDMVPIVHEVSFK